MVASLSDPTSQVLAEIQAGGGLSLSAVGRQFPAHRGEGTVNPSTVFRWAMSGAKAADGRRVKLEVARVGGRWLTSKAAVGRFVAALSSTGQDEANTPSRTPAARQKASEEAGAELDKRWA